jgi:hypothetical protein
VIWDCAGFMRALDWTWAGQGVRHGVRHGVSWDRFIELEPGKARTGGVYDTFTHLNRCTQSL